MMDLYAIIDQAADLLRQRGRVTSRALKAQFALNDEQLAALKDELLFATLRLPRKRGEVWYGAALRQFRVLSTESHPAPNP